jgi:hypothetical protein
VENLTDKEQTEMTQVHDNEKICGVCNQSFQSDGELQDHRKTAHSKEMNTEKQPSSNAGRRDQSEQERKHIA